MAERGSGQHSYPHQPQTSTSSNTNPSTAASQQQSQQQQQQQQTQQASLQQQQAAALHQAQLTLLSKDVNHVHICRVGQEIVHDIVGKAQEIFQLLSAKNLQVLKRS
jgi:hypothetical protein